MSTRSGGDDHIHPSSQTPYAALSTPEKDERLRRLHLESKTVKLWLDQQRDKLDLACVKSNAAVDKVLNSDIRLWKEETLWVRSTPKMHPSGFCVSNKKKLHP